MNYKNEKQILNIIKYTPPLFIISISIIITFFLYSEKQLLLEEEKRQIKIKFIKNNKEIIKKDVDKLHEFIKITQEDTERRLKKHLKNRVYEAHKIAMSIYNKNKNKKTDEEIKQKIKDALVHIRFNEGRGYYFIYSIDNFECILLPVNRKLEGKNFYNVKDVKGNFLARKVVKQIKEKKEGYSSWWYHKPDDMINQYQKIGFNMLFEPYNWFIGTGEYFIDYEKIVKEEVLKYITRISSSEHNYNIILDYKGKVLVNNKKGDDSLSIKRSVKFDLINIAKLGEGYLSYNNGENSSGSNLIKTSYSKGLDDWEWVITKNFQQNALNELFKEKEDKLNKQFDTNVIYIFNITLVLTFILLIISIYISKILHLKFQNYKNEIQDQIKENTQQQHILSQQAKMAAMGEMLGNIAHQWRQPLSLITTAASGMKMQKEFSTLDDETFERSIFNITNSAQYLSKTIDDFRNFFKTDKDKSNIKIKDAIEKALKLTIGQFKSSDIIIIKNIEDYEIYGLENELIQALINIINNSRDALITKEQLRQITFNTYTKGKKGILEIIDNGGGINEKILDKIFEPYFTTKHKSQGTGIGLYMTEEIIKKHLEGSIRVKNKIINIDGIEYQGVRTRIIFNLECD